ncbi:PREDICTED: uncharacterized protein LOC104758967 [Camelina sativa]|uniref:Uncharacterized protein LOC104758967 n=1 Tax=Camelina sativa TaxID=90675 RepID=A0ABM0X3Y7_CAMSA|nr:PREDICTED: uncharacterized protein LOC104758967 [Camelina sativa]
MVSLMKIMMVMVLLVIGVSAETVVELCKRTMCKTQCQGNKFQSSGCSDCLLGCAWPGSTSKIDQRALCLKNCDVGCGPSNDCYQRCIKRCPSLLI